MPAPLAPLDQQPASAERGKRFHTQRWQWSQATPSLHPRDRRAYLHGAWHRWGWFTVPQDGQTVPSGATYTSGGAGTGADGHIEIASSSTAKVGKAGLSRPSRWEPWATGVEPTTVLAQLLPPPFGSILSMMRPVRRMRPALSKAVACMGACMGACLGGCMGSCMGASIGACIGACIRGRIGGRLDGCMGGGCSGGSGAAQKGGINATSGKRGGGRAQPFHME